MASIAMCKAVCGDCEGEFPYPWLGDFAYGDFILHREDGCGFCYLQAIDNDVWDFVAARVRPGRNVHVSESGAILQEVVARLADHAEGQSFTMEMVCPHCRSRRFGSWGGERVSFAEIPDASFQSFSSLDDRGKERLICELEKQVKAEQVGEPNAAPPRG